MSSSLNPPFFTKARTVPGLPFWISSVPFKIILEVPYLYGSYLSWCSLNLFLTSWAPSDDTNTYFHNVNPNPRPFFSSLTGKSMRTSLEQKFVALALQVLHFTNNPALRVMQIFTSYLGFSFLWQHFPSWRANFISMQLNWDSNINKNILGGKNSLQTSTCVLSPAVLYSSVLAIPIYPLLTLKMQY